MFDNRFDDEREYMSSLKQNDSYHFSVPFEYIEKNYGDGQYDIETIKMEVDVNWDETELGYRVTYSAPGFDAVDPNQGNGSVEEFYECLVENTVLEELESLGIGAEAMVGGNGK